MRRRNTYIVAAVAVGITAAYALLLLAPQLRRLSTMRSSITALEEQLASGAVDVAGLSQVEANLQRTSALLADHATRIPPEARVGSFVEEMSSIAGRLGLRDQNIVPKPPLQFGTVATLPIQISFVADSAVTHAFLRELESLPRVVQITSVAMERTESVGESRKRGRFELSTEMSVQIFYEVSDTGTNV
ncbi:MAG: type 4a pilus biogenesis protein PilO [bacterium]|nr:type 4a pilus biogenesis protein PilO [bacterium]